MIDWFFFFVNYQVGTYQIAATKGGMYVVYVGKFYFAVVIHFFWELSKIL